MKEWYSKLLVIEKTRVFAATENSSTCQRYVFKDSEYPHIPNIAYHSSKTRSLSDHKSKFQYNSQSSNARSSIPKKMVNL
ncbi:hypothetical protein RJ641_005793 [Dillenia turbinata]|uniref:Uncharacterized protein n=1 Tax=Dillenia turbinata TaxID=194707 RepID=A0AAN8VDB9_9MAGN